MRNILIHRYFEIDREAVWAAVERALPTLKIKISEILAISPANTEPGALK